MSTVKVFQFNKMLFTEILKILISLTVHLNELDNYLHFGKTLNNSYVCSYNSESYLFNRAAPCSRRGFGGNYRRRSPRPEASHAPARSPPTSPVFDTSVVAGGDDDDDSGGRLGTQSMPGTLDRRYCRDLRTPLDGALLMKAAVDLSRSYHEGQAAATDVSATCSSSMSRSSDVIETVQVSADISSSSNASNSASSEVEVGHCQEERTPQESADVPVTGSVDVQHGELLKSTSVSAADSDRKPTHSRRVVFRQRRSRSDEAKAGSRRRKELISEDVGLRRRRCRSLERRQSSTDAKLLRYDAMTSSEGRDRSGELGSGGTVRKSDSFDSGIDTKSESTTPRTGGTDDVVDSGVNSRQDVVSPPSSTFREVTPEVLSLTVEEVEYDRKAATLVRCLGDDDAELRRVLTSSVSYRVPTCYVCGVFDNVVRLLSSDLREPDECPQLSITDNSSTAAVELKVRPLL